MSEIKGQLLGMIIVLSIFAVIGVTLVSAFKANASDIAETLKDETLIQVVSTVKSYFIK